jgi:hypothetical protein
MSLPVDQVYLQLITFALSWTNKGMLVMIGGTDRPREGGARRVCSRFTRLVKLQGVRVVAGSQHYSRLRSCSVKNCSRSIRSVLPWNRNLAFAEMVYNKDTMWLHGRGVGYVLAVHQAYKFWNSTRYVVNCDSEVYLC